MTLSVVDLTFSHVEEASVETPHLKSVGQKRVECRNAFLHWSDHSSTCKFGLLKNKISKHHKLPAVNQCPSPYSDIQCSTSFNIKSTKWIDYSRLEFTCFTELY